MARLATVLTANAAARVEPFLPARVGAAEPSRPVRLRFGSFELDPKSGELTGGHTTVVLQWQPLQLLLMLIDRCGEMITRDEIQKRLWGEDVIVDFDHSIKQLARKLRRVLGDSAKAPNYIETLARRGYRLKVPVEVLEKPRAATVATNVVQFSAGKPPAQWNGQDAGEPAASGRGSALRLRELAGAAEQHPYRTTRCRLRSPRVTDDCRDSLTPLVRNVSEPMLRQCISAASPAERLDALRHVLILMAQVLEGAPV